MPIIDNPHLLAADPNYVNRLRASGSPELQRMWIDGDWDAGLEGQFFTEWSRARHVIEPFEIPPHWTRICSGDWGSARPFAFHWAAVVQDTFQHDGRTLQIEAVVHRPAPGPGMEKGLILSEAEWEQQVRRP